MLGTFPLLPKISLLSWLLAIISAVRMPSLFMIGHCVHVSIIHGKLAHIYTSNLHGLTWISTGPTMLTTYTYWCIHCAYSQYETLPWRDHNNIIVVLAVKFGSWVLQPISWLEAEARMNVINSGLGFVVVTPTTTHAWMYQWSLRSEFSWFYFEQSNPCGTSLTTNLQILCMGNPRGSYSEWFNYRLCNYRTGTECFPELKHSYVMMLTRQCNGFIREGTTLVHALLTVSCMAWSWNV